MKSGIAATVFFGLTMPCAGSGGSSMDEIEMADPAAYRLEIMHCDINPQAIKGFFGVTEPGQVVLIEIAITNQGSVTRRFQIRPTVNSAAGIPRRAGPITTHPIKPGATFTSFARTGVLDTDKRPYSCTAEVWNSILDIIEPLDQKD